MKVSDHMLRGYGMSKGKAIGTLEENGKVCAIGAYLLSRYGDALETSHGDWNEFNDAFEREYGVSCAMANNGVEAYGEDRSSYRDEDGLPGLSIPVIAGMLKAIGY